MTQEAIERKILNFHLVKGEACDGRNTLGRLNGTPFEIVYGVFHYQRRITSLPGEPFTPDWTSQPVLALAEINEGVGITKTRVLAYTSDVRSLPEGLPEKVAAHLENWQSLRRKITGEWDV